MNDDIATPVNPVIPATRPEPYEAIILAGGLGTRLRSVVADLPKCMAPVAGRPFLFFVINFLRSEGVEKFIFSLGYKHEMVEAYLEEQFATLNYQVVIEDEPMGTGGAARLACGKATGKNVLLANGDTLFRVNINQLFSFHTAKKAACTLSLKPMKDFDRYGVVELESDSTVKSFKEKQYYESGLINGGLYLLDAGQFLKEEFPEKFSFENDYLDKAVNSKNPAPKIYGLVQDHYFIDIGIPEDFNKAGKDFEPVPFDLKKITNDWTLFLDRDGVINKEKPGSYVFNPGEFIFYDGVLPAFGMLAKKFGRIIIITNQRGIGKGLMTDDDLASVHDKLMVSAKKEGALIDAIYYCSSVDNNHPDRKPNPGMAVRAKNDFPAIDFSKSVMVGNNPGDMRFGRNAGMYTVFVKTTKPYQPIPHPDIDLAFDSLADFAKAL